MTLHVYNCIRNSVIKNSANSEKYRKAIVNPCVPLVISTGPAGTGKSYKACTYAAELMRTTVAKTALKSTGSVPAGLGRAR